MPRLVIGSLRRDAGKTSLIVGLGGWLDRPFGYLKPIGDRLIYHRKKLADLDSVTLGGLFTQTLSPEEVTLGFEADKLHQLYDDAQIATRLQEIADRGAAGGQPLLVEAGRDLTYGSTSRLDAISLAQTLDAPLVLVIRGDERKVLDDAVFLARRLDLSAVPFAGLVINKVRDLDTFRAGHLPELERLGLPILGLLPLSATLQEITVRHLSERLGIKVLTGQENLDRPVHGMYVGPMSRLTALSRPHQDLWGRVVITSGDRLDIALAGLQRNAAAVVLTNNLLPGANLLATFDEAEVPLLATDRDSYNTARRIAELTPLLTAHDTAKRRLLARLVQEHLEVNDRLWGAGR